MDQFANIFYENGPIYGCDQKLHGAPKIILLKEGI